MGGGEVWPVFSCPAVEVDIKVDQVTQMNESPPSCFTLLYTVGSGFVDC